MFLSAGGAMGFTARQTLDHTAWEFWCVLEGWQTANSAPEPDPMTRTELDDIIREHGLDGG